MSLGRGRSIVALSAEVERGEGRDSKETTARKEYSLLLLCSFCAFLTVPCVQDLNYGSVQRYSSSLTDPVKRPRDPVRQVHERLKTDSGDHVSYSGGGGEGKDGGAWATGIRHFEKSPPKASSFENLHSELRKSKGLSALAPKDSGSATWGEMRFFQEKPKTTSPLDMLRDRMQKVR